MFNIFKKRSYTINKSINEVTVDDFNQLKTYSGISVNEQSALEHPAVYAAIKRISSSLSILPIHIYNGDGKEKIINTEHTLNNILRLEVDDNSSVQNFIYAMEANVLLFGNSFAEIERDNLGYPVALHLIHPQYVSLLIQDNRKFFKVNIPGIKNTVFEDYDMLHLFGYSQNGIWGINPIVACKEAISLGLGSYRYTSAFFANGARQSGFITSPLPITSKEDREKAAQVFGSAFSGVKKFFGIGVLPPDSKYTPISFKNEEAQLKDVLDMSTKDIARIFDVPMSMIGEGEKSKYSNYEWDIQSYVTYCLYPWIKIWESELERKCLFENERGNTTIRFNVDGLLRANTDNRIKYYESALKNGWMSLNEIREKEGMNPIDNGDNYFIQANNLDTVDNVVGDTESKEPIEPIEPIETEEEVRSIPPTNDINKIVYYLINNGQVETITDLIGVIRTPNENQYYAFSDGTVYKLQSKTVFAAMKEIKDIFLNMNTNITVAFVIGEKNGQPVCEYVFEMNSNMFKGDFLNTDIDGNIEESNASGGNGIDSGGDGGGFPEGGDSGSNPGGEAGGEGGDIPRSFLKDAFKRIVSFECIHLSRYLKRKNKKDNDITDLYKSLEQYSHNALKVIFGDDETKSKEITEQSRTYIQDILSRDATILPNMIEEMSVNKVDRLMEQYNHE